MSADEISEFAECLYDVCRGKRPIHGCSGYCPLAIFGMATGRPDERLTLLLGEENQCYLWSFICGFDNKFYLSTPNINSVDKEFYNLGKLFREISESEEGFV